MKQIILMCALSTLAMAQADMKKISYAIGAQMATNFSQQNIEIDVDSFVKGLTEGLAGTSSMTNDQIAQLMTQFQTELREKQTKERAESGGKNQADADAFLAANKSKEGIKTTASGLQYQVITTGAGKTPSATDRVSVHYHGTLKDGTVFDSSVDRGTPAEFPVNGVIKGWTEALQLMKEGDKWRLFIPPGLAYGERGAGAKIGPNTMLIFDVELLEVK